MNSASRYLAFWAVSLLVALALAAGLNIFVNPYDVFAEPRMPGINVLKPGSKNHTAMTKMYQIERARPVTVALGSSRTYIGIDAASAAWPEAMQPVYNYGIPGNIEAIALMRNLREAWATGRLRNAVVFLDYLTFLAPDPPPGRGEDERRMLLLDDGSANPDRTVQHLDDAFLSVFTMGALVDSVSTVLSQGGGNQVLNVRPDGTAVEADFFITARAEGMNALFAQKDVLDLSRTIGFQHALADWHGPMPNLWPVRDMIRFCLEHDIKLTLILGASHADGMEIIRRAGLWPRIEQLKVDLAAAMGEANSDTVSLWDFMEYSPYTTERVPAQGDVKTEMRWFWEQMHFQKSLGNAMISRVFSGTPTDFGERLTPANVEARNRLVREQQRAFVGWKLACEVTHPSKCPESGGASVAAVE
jgi:hypothetical protein